MHATGTIRTLLTATIAAAVAFCSMSALGDENGPQNPPGWWNDPNEAGVTVRAGWNFNPDPSDPNDDPNDPDLDQRPDWCDGPPDVGSWGDMQPMNGGWGISGRGKSGHLDFWVWNQYVQANVKLVWLQYDIFIQQGTADDGVIPAWPVDTERTDMGRNPRANRTQDLGNGWTRMTRGWYVYPQPMWEIITIEATTSSSVTGTVIIDNVWIGTHCVGDDQKQNHSEGYDYNPPFSPPDQPEPTFYCSQPWYGGTEWEFSGSLLASWLPEVTDHAGVVGIPAGMSGTSEITVSLYDKFDPEAIRPIFYQYDRHVGGGEVYSEELLPPGTIIENRLELVEEREEGWERVMVFLDAIPRPEWEAIRFSLFADPTGLEAVAIDNVILSAGRASMPTLRAASRLTGDIMPALPPEPVPQWVERYDSYALGSGLHGQGGWKGWDNDPTFDAFVTDAQAHSGPHAADVAAGSDVVREYEDHTSGKWAFTAWQYIPGDFQSDNNTPFDPGTYFLLLNTYEDGGPYHWSVQYNFDSNDGVLKVCYGNGQDTVDVPYVTDRWVRLRAVVDLDNDWTQVYYDDELLAEYSWTGGIYGGGGGALELRAVDLFANGSSSVYYDNLSLRPVRP